jgi:hypothetical protein
MPSRAIVSTAPPTPPGRSDPYVYTQVMDVAQWLIEQIGFDGFRFDFVKGYGPWMVKAIAEVRYLNKSQIGFKPFCVGECWDSERIIDDLAYRGQRVHGQSGFGLRFPAALPPQGPVRRLRLPVIHACRRRHSDEGRPGPRVWRARELRTESRR